MKHSDHPTEKSDSSTLTPAHDEVAKKANALYMKEGRPPGHEKQNWPRCGATVRMNTRVTAIIMRTWRPISGIASGSRWL